MMPRVQELPYCEDSAALFSPWAEKPWAAFLDSGFPHCALGRYDLLTADPFATVITRGEHTTIQQDGRTQTTTTDPFTVLRELLGPPTQPLAELPFAGGAIGTFAYDLARRLERLPDTATDREGTPGLMVGLYDWAVVVDHRARRSWLIGAGRDARTAARWTDLVRYFSQIQPLAWRPQRFRVLDKVSVNFSRERYAAAFQRIQHYIRVGDCYQVNLAQRFSVPCTGSPWFAYRYLRRMNAAPFGAYLNTPEAQILCSSPERFLSVDSLGRVETRPIKGTRPRGATPLEDAMRAQELQDSEKDRAENLMIVDLLRNDLGKCCQPGSVCVPRLFDVESYATVHHLVSTITGHLADGADALDLLRGCFPGGSVTGAPKIRAMEIIEELEPDRRGVYCGSIGHIGFDGRMDSNIAIRTFVHTTGHIRFWAGGGIVADSVMDEEYRECHAKGAALLTLLELLADAEEPDGV